jgi:SRSO17 transposase
MQKTDTLSNIIQQQQQQTSRNHFTDEEDELIKQYAKNYDIDKIKDPVDFLPNRKARHIKQRYYQYLNDKKIDFKFTQNEIDLLMTLVKSIGRKWIEIEKYFPNKNQILVKNKYNSLIKKGFINNDQIEMNEIKNKQKHYFDDLLNNNSFFAFEELEQYLIN